MFKSIRWTLQVWHAVILIMAVVSLGTILYVSAARTANTEINAELTSAARVFAEMGRSDPRPAIPSTYRRDVPQLAMASRSSPANSATVASDVSPQLINRTASFNQMLPALQRETAWARQIPQDCLHRLGWNESEQPYFIIWSSTGSILRNSLDCPSVPKPDTKLAMSASSTDLGFSPEFRQRGELREVITPGPDNSSILVGRSIHREEASLANLRLNLLGAGAVVTAVGLLGGLALTRRVLRPIHQISQTAQSISASDLSRRIDADETKSELGSLAQTLNDAFDRLQSAVRRQAEFTADASHELRTPLAVIHTSSELALRSHRTTEEYRQALQSNLRASRRMQSLVDSLLVLARGDADALDLNCFSFDLLKLSDECVSLLAPLSDKRSVRVEVHGQPIMVEADRDRILQLATNLISNAIQYNREGGTVTVSVSHRNGDAFLTVADTGIGIPAEDQPRIFERFFRVEKARSREVGGCGLGLAISSSIARAHGGEIGFTSTPSVGTVFTVRLPLLRKMRDHSRGEVEGSKLLA